MSAVVGGAVLRTLIRQTIKPYSAVTSRKKMKLRYAYARLAVCLSGLRIDEMSRLFFMV